MSLRHVLYSLLLHLVALGLILVSLDIAPRPAAMPRPTADVVNAVTVDSKQVDQELNRLKDLEQQKQDAEKKRIKALQEQARQAERQRKAEEQRLARARQQKQAEEQKTKQEQQRLAQLKQEQEQAVAKRKAEEEKQRQAEEAKQKAEAEAKRLADAKRKAEEAAKRKAAEKAMQQQMAEEEKARQAAQARKDQQLLGQYVAYMTDAIRRQFNIVGLPPGLTCTLVIHTIPSGDVVGVEVEKSSGNSVFDRRAELAVKKAAPLPVPDDPNTFERLQMREIRIEFAPQE